MVTDILKDLQPLLIGQRCCRVRVGRYKSLSMGFGEKIYHNDSRLVDAYYGEWEIGTYNCSWRVVKGNKILCGSNDPVENIEELNRNINRINFGSIVSLSKLTEIDLQLEIENGLFIDFIATTSYKDEYFHIFCPNNVYIEFTYERTWVIGKSDEGTSKQNRKLLHI